MKILKKFRDIILGVCAGVLLATAVSAVYAGRGDFSQVAPFTADSLWLLKQARVIVEAYQVDAAKKDVDESELVHGAMRGMLSAWKDPYTRFLDPEQLEEEKTSLEGSFGGLGINIASRDGKTLIISPIEGTPADRAGLRPMDEIVRVNDDIVIGWELDKIVKLLRGEPGTEVTIGIRRPQQEELLDFKIVRDNIKIETVTSKMLDNGIGYIRLRQFIKTSAPDVGQAVIKLKNENARGLILDLRNNGGGLLDAAQDICDLFIDGGLIVSTKGRVESANEEFYAHEGVLTKLPLVVLINEGSASASEIVAGALRDRNNTLLIGAKSFGKGSVQVLFNLSDGSGIFVTTARYFTPNDVLIDHVGLTPDISVQSVWRSENVEAAPPKPENTEQLAPQTAENGETEKEPEPQTAEPEKPDNVENPDTPGTPEKPAPKMRDPQLEKAQETILRLIAGESPESLRDPAPAAKEKDTVTAAVPEADTPKADAEKAQTPDQPAQQGDGERPAEEKSGESGHTDAPAPENDDAAQPPQKAE